MRWTRQTCLLQCKLFYTGLSVFLAATPNSLQIKAMTSSLPAPESSSAKRAHLMATAERLFYRDGFRFIGIDTLLAEAGVAKMTLYNHFASKEDLIVAVLLKRDQRFRESVAMAVEASGKSPTRRLLAVFDWHERWFGSDDFRGCAFIRALSEYPDPTHEIHKVSWQHKLSIQALLTGLAEAAGAKNPAGLAETLNMLLDGAIIAAHATGSTTPAITARTTAAILLKQAAA
jgi:AcrR family transcriptional regulator